VAREAWPAIVGGLVAWLACMHGELGDFDGGLALVRQAAEQSQQHGELNRVTILAARVQLELRATRIAQAAATLDDMEKETQ
jgi:hypothetical protein